MTDSPDPTDRTAATRARRKVITRLVLTAVLLLPLLVGLWHAANEAIEHKSTTDWRANHETKQSLMNAAALILGAPSLGAGLFWIGGVLLDRHWGVSAATGALLGSLGLWIGGFVAFYVALSNATFF